MKITMHTTAAGPRGVMLAGRDYDLPNKEAQVLIDGNFARPAQSEPPPRPQAPSQPK